MSKTDKTKFKVGDKITVKSLEEILNSGDHYVSWESYIKFDYTQIAFNKNYMTSFCEKTFFVESIVNPHEPSYRLCTKASANYNYDGNDVKEVLNFVWHEKWLNPELEFVLDFDGTPDEREA